MRRVVPRRCRTGKVDYQVNWIRDRKLLGDVGMNETESRKHFEVIHVVLCSGDQVVQADYFIAFG
jgi:hypothetical protein